MGLHDRLARTGDGADGAHVGLAHAPLAPIVDPYAELKAAVHHACIAKLGPELFKQEPDDLSDKVYRAVTEELAIAGLIQWWGSLGSVIALTAIPFVIGLAVIPFALETKGKPLP